MLIGVGVAMKSTITRLAGAVGHAVKRRLRPTAVIGAVTAATVHDVARSRSELFAENALL